MRFPTPSELRATLCTLLDDEVAVELGRVPNRRLLGHCTYELVDAKDNRRGVVAVELPLAHALGAAIAKITPRAVSNAEPQPYLLECAREVVNVVVGRIAVRSAIDVHIEPTADGRRPWTAPLPDASYRISIEGYSSGQLAITELHRSGLLLLDEPNSDPLATMLTNAGHVDR